MYKKRMDRTRSKKAQITVFIIVGLIILFSFIFVLNLSSNIQKGQLEEAKEGVLSKVFKKEALRIFVEDCLTDELERGLILIGKQGRLWSDQPGGTKNFVEGLSGKTYDPVDEEGRLFYGITREEYLFAENAYPCDNESSPPEFCQYDYPDTKLGFGKLELKSSTLQNDLKNFLINRTMWCVENFTKSNISSKAEIETEEMTLDLKITNDGIDIKAEYPLKLSLAGEEFFHLSNFDFFYPTKFKDLLEAAVVFPLSMDWKYVDFNYTRETLGSSQFTYGNSVSIRDCGPFKDYFLCNLSLNLDKYERLGVEMRIESMPDGDNVFIFQSPSYTVLNNPEQFVYRFVRQNRPPALDYIGRSGCPIAEYDYLIVKDDPELGDINITAFALDPDEDNLSYTFMPLMSLPVSENFDQEDNFYISNITLKNLEKGKYNLLVNTTDEHGLSDWQEVRILLDRPLELNVSLDMPYNFSAEDGLISYENKYFSGEFYLVSKEDPIFIKVHFPESSFLTSDYQHLIILNYTNQENTENFEYALPSDLNFDSNDGCFSLPGLKSTDCTLNGYSNNEISKWEGELLLNKLNNNFRELTEYGELNFSFSAKYCGYFDKTKSTQAIIKVKECSPNKNPEHPYAFPYYKTKIDAITGKYLGEEVINPFLATHSCCKNDWTIYTKEENHECYINPKPGCYGGIPQYTLSDNQPIPSGGYVLEEEYATCDGKRGNTCDGGKNYRLWNDELVCGNNSKEMRDLGCVDITKLCENQKSWGYVDTNGDEKTDTWCHGKMGCTSFCDSTNGGAVVDRKSVTEKGKIKDLNYLALTYYPKPTDDDSLGFGCGCKTGDNGKPCDNNFDGVFDKKCSNGVCG
ncbi:MAG: hypothetical protein ABH824_03995 [Nanoarchaeota archaeon]|nr:hypothetical protein [Nanoarchaeota archaeon]MBU1632552.1 hypothetical protein [Nanoarchaeota archaeon]MBU1876571.1 hypothetical protein [Nanoarchaeota archaeon]